MNYAIIKAGGSGKRCGYTTPKQFLKYKNKTILEYSLNNIILSNRFDKIVISCHKNYVEKLSSIISKLNFKNVFIVYGGDSGLESILNAFNFLKPNDDDIIFIHEAVRPFLSLETINNGLLNIKNNDFCISTRSISERITGFLEEDEKFANAFLDDTSDLVIFTHPEIYRTGFLRKLFLNQENIQKNNYSSPLDIIVQQREIKIPVFESDFNNFKITTKMDYLLFKLIVDNQN